MSLMTTWPTTHHKNVYQHLFVKEIIVILLVTNTISTISRYVLNGRLRLIKKHQLRWIFSEAQRRQGFEETYLSYTQRSRDENVEAKKTAVAAFKALLSIVKSLKRRISKSESAPQQTR